MLQFFDVLYGRIELPDWLAPFLTIPEFVRLRDVRLSNVDSIDYKDFGSANRWSHSIGVAYLANICADVRHLNDTDRATLVLASLLHDVATPPFAHTAEYVLANFAHELETSNILNEETSADSNPDLPVFGSALPRFHHECNKLSKLFGWAVKPEIIADCILGEGPLGFLISGTLDLDNADNVVRGSYLMGIPADRELPIKIARWLANQSSMPINLRSLETPIVNEWLLLRDNYYSNFFYSSDNELGRQALLQSLMRKAISNGLPRSKLVWNTDSGFLNALESLDYTRGTEYSLSDLVSSYRMLEPIHKVCEIGIDNQDLLRAIKGPMAVSFIEQEICGNNINMFVMVSSNKSGKILVKDLLSEPVGKFFLFKLGGDADVGHFPQWVRDGIPLGCKHGPKFRNSLSMLLNESLKKWGSAAPWNSAGHRQEESKIASLNGMGDWSFKHSKNKSLHAYPGTFVHAIPAAVINALGLQGGHILDPFGGTGQTATEAIKADCYAISGDSNTVASLITRAKFSYLSFEDRLTLLSITREKIESAIAANVPDFQLLHKWHHPDTLNQLCKILGFIQSQNIDCRYVEFLRMCFSAILTASTARRGKEHGFFADNTPLEKNCAEPPFQDAIQLFLNKVPQNVRLLESFYGQLERKGKNVEEEFTRVRVVHQDITTANPGSYGVVENSIDAIITSPPYLCMADYSLGNRLSYNWLFPNSMATDHSAEIGARRRRTNPIKAEELYFEGFDNFGALCARTIKYNGFLAIVLGEPQAKAFSDVNLMTRVDEILLSHGFELFWDKWRSIHWHRNQGYQWLRKERISIYRHKQSLVSDPSH